MQHYWSVGSIYMHAYTKLVPVVYCSLQAAAGCLASLSPFMDADSPFATTVVDNKLRFMYGERRAKSRHLSCSQCSPVSEISLLRYYDDEQRRFNNIGHTFTKKRIFGYAIEHRV